jgi:predicted HicB family RNase H-like nuclease
MSTQEQAKRTIALPIDLELHRRIRVAAARADIPMSEWIRRMLTFAVEADEKRSAK